MFRFIIEFRHTKLKKVRACEWGTVFEQNRLTNQSRRCILWTKRHLYLVNVMIPNDVYVRKVVERTVYYLTVVEIRFECLTF